MALREPALRDVTRDLDRQWKAAITEVIAEGVAAGEFRCPDPTSTALRLTALLDGLAVQMTAYPARCHAPAPRSGWTRPWPGNWAWNTRP